LFDIKQKSILGLAWDLAGKIGLQGVGFFVSIILARLLSPEDFGILAIIMVFINLANVFLDFGFSTALVQKSEVTEEHYSSVFFMNIIAGIILAAIVFMLAPFIANFYDNETLTNLIRVMSISFVINAFGNVTKAHLKRELNFKLITYSSIPSAFISGAIALYMAYNGFGIWSLVIQIIIGQLLGNIFLFVGCQVKFRLKFNMNAAKDLWAFSSKIFSVGILNSLFSNIDSLLIGKLLSPSTLGFYYRAKSLESFSYKYTGDAISNVLFASLSSLQNDIEKFKNSTLSIFHMLSFVSFFICGLLFINSYEIIVLLFSIKWELSVPIFKILIFGGFIAQIGTLFYNVILSTGNVKKYTKMIYINYTLQFSNFFTLWIWGLNTYLITAIIIKISILYLSIVYSSDILKLKEKLFKYIFKDFIQYVTIIALVTLFRNNIYSSYENLYLNLILSSFTYVAIFFIISKFRKNIGMSLIISELSNFNFKDIFSK